MNSINKGQALAQVFELTTQAIEVKPGEHRWAYVMGSMLLHTHLGFCDETTLEQALWRAHENINIQADCNLAIFPMSSQRAMTYMAIEKELLTQEKQLGTPMYEQFAADPRDLITLLMDQLRECATALIMPVMFENALVRVGCLVIAGLQWTNNWLAHLKLREAARETLAEEAPKVVAMPPPPDPVPSDTPPPPPLFGAEGIAPLQVVPEPEQDIVDVLHEAGYKTVEGAEAVQAAIAEAAGNPEERRCPACNGLLENDHPSGEPCAVCGETIP